MPDLNKFNLTDCEKMKQVKINGKNYIELSINSSILLDDNQLDRIYYKFRLSKARGAFIGSFTEFCEFCFTMGANFYLTRVSDILSGVNLYE